MAVKGPTGPSKRDKFLSLCLVYSCMCLCSYQVDVVSAGSCVPTVCVSHDVLLSLLKQLLVPRAQSVCQGLPPNMQTKCTWLLVCRFTCQSPRLTQSKRTRMSRLGHSGPSRGEVPACQKCRSINHTFEDLGMKVSGLFRSPGPRLNRVKHCTVQFWKRAVSSHIQHETPWVPGSRWCKVSFFARLYMPKTELAAERKMGLGGCFAIRCLQHGPELSLFLQLHAHGCDFCSLERVALFPRHWLNLFGASVGISERK